MTLDLVRDDDSLARQNQKLREIAEALMRRVEQEGTGDGAAFAQFERAAVLEKQVRERTRDLEHALDLLNASNAQLAAANRETEAARADLAGAIGTLQEGFALFDPEDRLVLCNSRFGDGIAALSLSPGLPFTEYVEAVSKSPSLVLAGDSSPEDWARQRLLRHAEDHVIFNVALTGDRWLQVSEHRTPRGGTVIMQTEISDIIRTEREARGKLLDRQARMIRATLDHINQGVCIFDADARLVGWNRQMSQLLSVPLTRFRLGVEFHQLFERLRDGLSFLGGTDAQTMLEWVGKRRPRAALRFEIQRGSVTVLDVFAQEMPDRGFVISFTDVTAERRASAALAEANELLERRVHERTVELEAALAAAERANASKIRFVAAASHDLLQPLSAAKLYIASVAGDDADRAVAGKAANALDSVEAIIEALLDISRLDSDQASLDIGSFSLGEMLASLADEFAPAAARKGLRFQVLPTRHRVRSDPGFLRRILQNLIANAVRYTETGRVLVGVRQGPEGVRVEVHDTGPGIAEGDREAIFREFHRLEGQGGDGIGLGLAIVERASARLGHPIGLRSRLGVGSVFSVGLPLAPAATGDRPEGKAVQSARRGQVMVLLVENNKDMQNALAAILERWGVGVIVADGAEEALEILDEIAIAPDALLIDYGLDGADTGVDLLQRLRAWHGDIPARIISAHREPRLAAHCAAAGAPLLTKPLSAAALEAFVFSAAR